MNELIDRAFIPPPRLLMGPGPITCDPRVLRAMSCQMIGQFDPAMTECMNHTMALYRDVFKTTNHWTFLIDATARGGIEAALVSLLSPGDKVLVPVFGRFGLLLKEIAERCGAKVVTIEVPWGEVCQAQQIADALKQHRPKLLALVQGDTSTTMCQPLADIGKICREYGVLSYCDATASLGGNEFLTDSWGLSVVSAGLQKCLGGPSGIAPITLNAEAEAVINARRHIEAGIRAKHHRDAAGERHLPVVVGRPRHHVGVRVQIKAMGFLRHGTASARSDVECLGDVAPAQFTAGNAAGEFRLVRKQRTGTPRGAFGERERGGLLLGGRSCEQHLLEIGDPVLPGIAPDESPEFGRNGPGRRPAFMREVAQHAGKTRICPRIQSLNQEERTPNEDRLQHHLIPLGFVELLRGKRIPQRDRLEDRGHVAADAFGSAKNPLIRMWQQRKRLVEGDGFAHVGRLKDLLDRLEVRCGVRMREREQEARACGLIQAPAVGVPSGPYIGSRGEIIILQFQVRLAEVPGHRAEGREEHPVRRAFRDPALLRVEPLPAGLVAPRGDPIGQQITNPGSVGGHGYEKWRTASVAFSKFVDDRGVTNCNEFAERNTRLMPGRSTGSCYSSAASSSAV